MNEINTINVVIDISRLFACYSERFVDMLVFKLNGWNKLVDLAIATAESKVNSIADCINFIRDEFEKIEISEREYTLIKEMGEYIRLSIPIPINKVIHADCSIRHNNEWYTSELYLGFV